MAEHRLTPAELEDEVRLGVLRGLFLWGMHGKQLAQGFAPVDTGRLAASIKVDPKGAQEMERGRYRILIGTNVEYARAHEFGSGIHALDPAKRELIEITAGYWTGKSSKKSLWFAWPAGPKPHPAYNEEKDRYAFRSVYHPGVRAANAGEGYLRKGAKESKDLGRRLVLESLKAELTR